MATAIAQKHLCYVDAYKRKLHTKLYGLNNFRVLFVVNGTTERVSRMQHVFERTVKDKIAPGVFLYTTNDALEQFGPYGEIWINGAGESVGLL